MSLGSKPATHRGEGGKTSKILFSETMRPRAKIFSTLQCLLVSYINPTKHPFEFKLATSPKVICIYRAVQLNKNLKKGPLL